MGSIRVVAAGLTIASLLMAIAFKQIFRALHQSDIFSFAQTLKLLSPNIADLLGVKYIIAAIVVLAFVGVGLWIASVIDGLLYAIHESIAYCVGYVKGKIAKRGSVVAH